MLITIASIIVALVCCFWMKRNLFSDDPDDFCGVGCTILVSLLLTIIMHVLTWPFKPERPVVTTTQNIVAMKYDSKLEGEFRAGLFFYRCQVDDVDYYVYLTEADGVYRQERVQIDNTVVKETSGQPRVVKTKSYIQNGLPWWIRFKKQYPEMTHESDTIFVPVGTVSECTKYEIF